MFNVFMSLMLIGHFLGAFYLNSPDYLVRSGQNVVSLLKWGALYLVSMLLATLPIISLTNLVWIIIFSIILLLISLITHEIGKRKHEKKSRDVFIYILTTFSQLVALFIIAILVYIHSEPIQYLSGVQHFLDLMGVNEMLLFSWLLAILVIIQPVSFTIKTVLRQYRPSLPEEEGRPNAGALIGVLERSIILLLLAVGQYAAIGFVLTAKSIARYKKIGEDPTFSEYYLLGTLLSTLLVILAYLTILK